MELGKKHPNLSGLVEIVQAIDRDIGIYGFLFMFKSQFPFECYLNIGTGFQINNVPIRNSMMMARLRNHSSSTLGEFFKVSVIGVPTAIYASLIFSNYKKSLRFILIP